MRKYISISLILILTSCVKNSSRDYNQTQIVESIKSDNKISEIKDTVNNDTQIHNASNITSYTSAVSTTSANSHYVSSCVGAISEKTFDMMVKSISRGDKKTFDAMLLSGDLIDVPSGSCEMIKGGITKCLIEFTDSRGKTKRAYVYREVVD